MAKGFFSDITAPYTGLEAWFYDRYIAPAVVEVFEAMAAGQLERIEPQGEVLDVGCGGGHEMGVLAKLRPDLRISGIDLNTGQVARASARLGRYGDRVSVRTGNAMELPFEDGRFHFVMSLASIKHWPDPARGLAECVRVLRPGGRLLVAEADRACRHEDALSFVRSWRTPGFAKPLDLMLFRTWVAGRSLERDELARLAEALPLSTFRIDRPEGTPGLRLDAVK